MLKPFLVPRHAEEKITKTLNNGYLGSRNDEERSEMRYVVRIAGCKRVIESLNAYCARGSGRGHVCLSVSRYPQFHLLGGRWSWPSRDRFVGRAGRLKRSGAPRPRLFFSEKRRFGLSVVVSVFFRTSSDGCPVIRARRQPAGALRFGAAPAPHSSPFDLRSGKATRRI